MSMINVDVAIRIGHMAHPAPLSFSLIALTESLRLLCKQQTPPICLASLFLIGRIQRAKSSFVYARLRTFLEEEIGSLDSACAHLLQYSPIEPELRSVLAERRITPSEINHFVAYTSSKWKLFEGNDVYVARVTDSGRVVLSRERHPILSAVIDCLELTRTYFRWQLPTCMKRALFIAYAILHKYLMDRSESLFVNIGAGVWYAPRWKNLDFVGKWYSSHRWLIDYSHDLVQCLPMPFKDGSVDLFYSEHVFEHLPDEVCAKVFAELFRSLAPSGGLRIVVPDADLLYEKLKQQDREFFKRLLRDGRVSLPEAFLILIAHPRKPINERIFWNNLNSLRRPEFLDYCKEGLIYEYARAGEHINWFNFEKLRSMLHAAGFSIVQLSTAQQCRFQQIRGKPFDTRANYSLHVDAIKSR